MLPPDYLAEVRDALIPLMDEYQTSLLSDMARRIAKVGMSDASVWQLMAYQEAGGVFDDAMQRLAAMTGKTQSTLRDLFESAGATAIDYDDAVYEAAGLTPIPLRQSPAALQALTAGLQKTSQQVQNLTMTTAMTSQQSFFDAIDLAYIQVTGGGMSHQQAITHAVRSMARDGLHVQYPTGHRDKIDVAARRAVLTGVNQTTAQISMQHAVEMGCEHVEVTAHAGARPSHASWQGRVYRISDGEFESVTGYGTGAGLCGWNCRHSFYPFFEGISTPNYSQEDLQRLEQSTVVYDGEEIGRYDATQMQREMERDIRATKRELLTIDSLRNVDFGNEMVQAEYRQQYAELAAKLKHQRERLKDFEAQTGLPTQADRQQVLGFGRSEASRAGWSARKQANQKSIADFFNLAQEGHNGYDGRDTHYHDGDGTMFDPLQMIMKSAKVSNDEARKIFDALTAYSGDDYEEIRARKNAYYAELADLIDGYIAKAPKYDDTVYRGIRLDEDTRKQMLQDLMGGREIDMRGISSWTSEKETAINFSGYKSGTSKDSLIFVVDDVRTGTSIQHISSYGTQEAEVLAHTKARYILDGDIEYIEPTRYETKLIKGEQQLDPGYTEFYNGLKEKYGDKIWSSLSSEEFEQVNYWDSHKFLPGSTMDKEVVIEVPTGEKGYYLIRVKEVWP